MIIYDALVNNEWVEFEEIEENGDLLIDSTEEFIYL